MRRRTCHHGLAIDPQMSVGVHGLLEPASEEMKTYRNGNAALGTTNNKQNTRHKRRRPSNQRTNQRTNQQAKRTITNTKPENERKKAAGKEIKSVGLSQGIEKGRETKTHIPALPPSARLAAVSTTVAAAAVRSHRSGRTTVRSMRRSRRRGLLWLRDGVNGGGF